MLFRLIRWLMYKNKYKCPRCNFILLKNETLCKNCGQPLIPCGWLLIDIE